MELFKANAQWSTRPEDERFGSLPEMFAACKSYAASASTSNVPFDHLRLEAVDDDVKLTGRSGKFARLTHWAFGQMSRIVGAPADYLREQPATLATQNLNWGLKKRTAHRSDAQLLFHQNGDLLLRAVTSEQYARIWNWEVIERLISLAGQGWRTPPAVPARPDQKGTRVATLEDVGPGSRVKVGQLIAPAGLYASDHDMFAFLINDRNTINDGTGDVLHRGVMFWNSEVGAASIGRLDFLFKEVCGNHIVWGAQNVREIAIRHVGDVNAKWNTVMAEVKKYSNESVSDIEAKIAAARKKEIAATKEEVLDKLFGLRIASRKLFERAYEAAEKAQDRYRVSPNTVWGMVNGLTQISQESTFADKRVEIDRAAGKVLEIVF